MSKPLSVAINVVENSAANTFCLPQGLKEGDAWNIMAHGQELLPGGALSFACNSVVREVTSNIKAFAFSFPPFA